VATRAEKSPTSFICGVDFDFLSDVALNMIPRALANSVPTSITGWKVRCNFDGGIGTTTSGLISDVFMNPVIAPTMEGIAPLSPLYFKRYTSSPKGDSNSVEFGMSEFVVPNPNPSVR